MRLRTIAIMLGLGFLLATVPVASAAPQQSETKRYFLGLDTPGRSLYYLSCEQAPFFGGACFTPPPSATDVVFDIVDQTTTTPGALIKFLSPGGQLLHSEEQCEPTSTAVPEGTGRIQVYVNGTSTQEACGDVAAGTTGEITATFTLAEPGVDPDDGTYYPSAPSYGVIAEPKQYVQSGDNSIEVNVYRPNASGQFPVLVWFDVYYKDDSAAVVNSERDYFVSRGYVFVQASSPGSNSSGGTYENAFGPKEQLASYDVVEWAAIQPWSDGQVGMQGLSYAAIIEYFTAAMRPPHLVTIYPTSAYSDLYREIVYAGGNLQAGYPIVWDVNNRSYGYLPPTRESSDNQTTATNYATTVARYRPILPDFLLHPYADEFYSVRSPATSNSQIEIPAAIDVGWGDDMVYGGPINFETIASTKKRLTIGPWGHSEAHRRPDGRSERLRWFDYYLKGKPSDVDADPTAKVFVSVGGDDEGGYWTTASAWPIPGIHIVELALGADGSLGGTGLAGDVSYSYSPTGHTDTVTSAPLSDEVVFESEPLTDSVTSIGYSEVVLYAATSALDTSFTVEVADVSPDGTSRRLQSGWLRASMRKVDSVQSEPGRPFHDFSGPTDVIPGEVFEARIAIWPFANEFPAGHRIRVTVSDSPRGPGGAPALAPLEPGTNSIFTGPGNPSRLLLSVL